MLTTGVISDEAEASSTILLVGKSVTIVRSTYRVKKMRLLQPVSWQRCRAGLSDDAVNAIKHSDTVGA